MTASRRALILAAGRGERMRPLTDTVPKPLLPAGGKPLVVHHLQRLAAAGIGEVVINIAHLADRFPEALGDGSAFGLRIHWSREGEVPLETGGGMLHALPRLGDEPFVVVNGDVFSDFDFAELPAQLEGLAHLVLVDRPPEKQRGDFGLGEGARLEPEGPLTYAGIGLYHPTLLDNWRDHVPDTPDNQATPPRFPLAPILRAHMVHGRITGQHHGGHWTDVGTPERLRALDEQLAQQRGR